MSSRIYLPVNFGEMVVRVIHKNVEWSAFEERELGVALAEFWELRIRKEYREKAGNAII